jgi:hypothetical protein
MPLTKSFIGRKGMKKPLQSILIHQEGIEKDSYVDGWMEKLMPRC